MSIEVLGIEDFHNKLIEEAKKEKSKYDKDLVKKEVELINQELKNSNPEVVIVDDLNVIKIKLKNAISFIIVYPPKYLIKAVEAMNDIKKLSSVLEESYNLIIFYSKKGKLTTSAYLYLGNVMEENEVGILFINGDAKEIIEVFNTLEKSGSYTPDEGSFVDIDF